MSVSDKEISSPGGNVIVDDGNVGDGENKDDGKGDDGGDGGVGVSVAHENDQRRERGCGCMPRWNLAKVRKAFGSSSNWKLSRQRRRRKGKGSGSCFSRPETVESPAESHLSDPEDLAFTHEMLRDLLERNAFYSRECNTHLDIHFASCEHRWGR